MSHIQKNTVGYTDELENLRQEIINIPTEKRTEMDRLTLAVLQKQFGKYQDEIAPLPPIKDGDE